MREREQFHFRRQEFVEPVERESAVVAHRDEASRAPVRSASSCHGTRLLWCSISVSRITSPSRRNLLRPS